MDRITFGKYKGTRWVEVPTDYLLWLRGNSSVGRYRDIALVELTRRRDETAKHLKEIKDTTFYLFTTARGERGLFCHLCGSKNYGPLDVAQGYCKFCNYNHTEQKGD